jgi:hypothetical protein
MDGSYAGVDWASDEHDVLVADAAGAKLLAATFAQDKKGLRSLCRALVRLRVQHEGDPGADPRAGRSGRCQDGAGQPAAG